MVDIVQNNILVQFLAYVVAPIATIAAAYFAWRQYKVSKEYENLKNIIKLHRCIEILKKREEVVNKLVDIILHADRGDIIFGHCNTCSNYPDSFYTELQHAVGRGVKVEFVVRSNPGSENFLTKLRGLNRDNVRIKVSDVDYIRLFGIRGKEVIFAVNFNGDYYGIYLKDDKVTKYLEKSFDAVWQESVEFE